MNSRQSAYPVGADPWVRQTLRAVEYCAGQGMAVVTSTGMNTWELVLAIASQAECPVIIITADSSKDPADALSALIGRFELTAKNVLLLYPQRFVRSKQDRLHQRDAAIIRTADLLLPVSIRPRGSLDSLITETSNAIFRRYQIEYRASKRPRPRYDPIRLSDRLEDDSWLVHFTRTARGPWPHQSDRDFYLSVLASGRDFCNSAVNGLSRMLSSTLIYANKKHIKSSDFVVGFTLMNRETVPSLFRYRPRDINPYFEPYGIAIKKTVAIAAGIRPVIYATSDVFADMPGEDKPYFQAIGRYAQWVKEREYRYLGNFDLTSIPSDAIRILVPSPREVKSIQDRTSYQVQALFDA